MSGKTAEHTPSYTIYFMYRMSQDKNMEKNMETQNKRFENITSHILSFVDLSISKSKILSPQKIIFWKKINTSFLKESCFLNKSLSKTSLKNTSWNLNEKKIYVCICMCNLLSKYL
jgi:hypothetical protein